MIILLSLFFDRSHTLHPPPLPSSRQPHPPSHRNPPSLHSHHPLPLSETTTTHTVANSNAAQTPLHCCHNQLPQSTIITSTASAYHPPTTATNHSRLHHYKLPQTPITTQMPLSQLPLPLPPTATHQPLLPTAHNLLPPADP
jgi:hypothetical protein